MIRTQTLLTILMLLMVTGFSTKKIPQQSWIRINVLGYKPLNLKVAVWCSKEPERIDSFQLIDAQTKQPVFRGSAGTPFDAYGPFKETYRFDFSAFKKAGRYYLQAGQIQSPEFRISA